MNREAWLHNLADSLKPLFASCGYTIPDIAISCGFTINRNAIGECWPSSRSASGVYEIFIHPSVCEGFEVAEILMHELVHACVGVEHKHRGPFPLAAKALGLDGPMTATKAGERLRATLVALLETLGTPYPHGALDSSKITKQSTRMIKLSCPKCGYVVRTTRKWIETYDSLPVCPCGVEMCV